VIDVTRDQGRRSAGIRFVGLDLRAVGAPQVLVQRAIEVRLLRVYVYRRRFVNVQAVRVRP
jgi:hypothetical protein